MISVSLCVKKHPSWNLHPLVIGELIIKSNVEEKLLIVIPNNNGQSWLSSKTCRHGTPRPASTHGLRGKREGEKVGSALGPWSLGRSPCRHCSSQRHRLPLPPLHPNSPPRLGLAFPFLTLFFPPSKKARTNPSPQRKRCHNTCPAESWCSAWTDPNCLFVRIHRFVTAWGWRTDGGGLAF